MHTTCHFTKQLLAVLMIGLLAEAALGYRVMPSLNTYTTTTGGVGRVGELQSDGAWFITKNSDFSDSQWQTIFTTLGGIGVSEDNPASNKSYIDYRRIMSDVPFDSLCYNETGGLPGGTLLRDGQIDAMFDSHGSRGILCLTRSYGGAWKTETDRCLANPKVEGIVMEYVKKALLENINAPGKCIKAIRAAGKRCYLLLHAGAGDGWTDADNAQIIRNLNAWAPAEMASDEVILVYQHYHGTQADWLADTESVKSCIIQACSAANYSGSGYEGGNSPTVEGATVRWDVGARYGVTADGIRRAISDAKGHFATSPNDTVVLEFGAGSFWLEDTSKRKGTIDLTGVKPGLNGRLIFQGKGMNETIFVFADNKHAMQGRDVHRVTFADMHMTRKNYTVSQGYLAEAAAGKVVLDIAPGFPTPGEIFNPYSDQGRYLRRYTDSKTDPHIIEDDNEQIPWVKCTHIEGRRWQLDLKQKKKVANYSPGDLIGIKSKHSKDDTEFGGQAYWFSGGEDFRFESVKWTHKSRGVFRGGFEKVQIVNCVIDRARPIKGQTPCLATPAGGPQIGQPNDPPTSGHVVQNCRFIGLGDDSVAFFNATGTIKDCYIRDSFVRGILVANAPETVLENNTVIRCPVQNTKDWRFHAHQKKLKEAEAIKKEAK